MQEEKKVLQIRCLHFQNCFMVFLLDFIPTTLKEVCEWYLLFLWFVNFSFWMSCNYKQVLESDKRWIWRMKHQHYQTLNEFKTFIYLIHSFVLGNFAWSIQPSCFVETGPKNDQRTMRVYISISFFFVIVKVDSNLKKS